MPRPITVGHRGASALAPENTLQAFELAIQYGLDMAELDVHLSRDGHVVVTHDAPAADLSARELQALGIPKLTDVFDLARRRLGLYVELKGAGTGAALADLIRRGAAHDVGLIIGSFLPSLLIEAEAETPHSVLFQRAALNEMIGTCASVGASYAHPCFRPVTAEMVDGLHQAGLLVMTPHTNDASEAQRFASLGVDVIASDDPRVLQALDVAA
jgi:glycerophosphoryl diester phosphodiesterase